MGMTRYLFDPMIDSIDVVLAIRAKAMTLMAEGKTVMEWQGEGLSAVKQFTMPIADVLEETRYFLKQADPATYGYPIIQVKPIHA
jgi:hypothetical protein